MNKYQLLKEQAREKSINYQIEQSGTAFAYGECFYWSNYFEKLGRRYGLLKEFRENGVL